MMVELNHMIAGSIAAPLSGSIVATPVLPESPSASPTFDLKAGTLFKIDASVDRAQVKELGETWKSSSV